jgi:hypothetical protein
VDTSRVDNVIPMVDRVYKYNVFQGFRQPVGLDKAVVAKVVGPGAVSMTMSYVLLGSQG